MHKIYFCMGERSGLLAKVALMLALSLGTACHGRAYPNSNIYGKPQVSSRQLSLETPPSIPDIVNGHYAYESQEQANDELNAAVNNWFHGPGLGRTMLNVGTSVAFPPYLIYLVGNAGLSLAGYQPIYFTDALPDAPRDGVLSVYDSITGVPGRLTSMANGREYAKPRAGDIEESPSNSEQHHEQFFAATQSSE